jgi:hypothetical protein
LSTPRHRLMQGRGSRLRLGRWCFTEGEGRGNWPFWRVERDVEDCYASGKQCRAARAASCAKVERKGARDLLLQRENARRSQESGGEESAGPQPMQGNRDSTLLQESTGKFTANTTPPQTALPD